MFIGRETELKDLKNLWRRPAASLVTVRGRRRIGKSTLIEEFARRNRVRFVKIEGVHPGPGVTNETQLENFARMLAAQTGTEYEPLTNWFDAFKRLDGCLSSREKSVLLLDEISWMGKYDPMFTGNLKIAWDNWFSKKPKLIMFLCGSVSSWIDKYILTSTGFVGRPTMRMDLRELSMRESYEFWKARNSGASVRDVVDVLSVVGGVPKYLEDVDPLATADENIGRMCFSPDGLLVKEFDEMFNDSLEEGLAVRKKLLTALRDGPLDMTELAKACGMEPNGYVTANLKALESAGFVSCDNGCNPVNGKKLKSPRYRICDNYVRFYLKYIEPNRPLIEKGAFRFSSIEQLPGLSAFLGLQFESLVNANLSTLMDELGLGRTLLVSAAPYSQRKTQRIKGCQIDLLIQTDAAIHVVEVKRRERIDEDVIDEVKEKVRRLKVRRGVSMFPELVYAGNVSKRIEAVGYFRRIISAEDLLGISR